MVKTFKPSEVRVPKKLTATERQDALKTLPGWKESEEGEEITKTYNFSSFSEALCFMVRVAFYVEKNNHHPTWKNVYNQVHVTLLTHECGGVSAKDIALAHYMEEAAFAFLNPCKSDPPDLIF